MTPQAADGGFRYEAIAESPLVKGPVAVAVGADALTLSALGGQAVVPFARIIAFGGGDWALHVAADDGPVKLSQMGQACAWLERDLREAFDAMALRALFVEGEPALTARGEAVCVARGSLAETMEAGGPAPKRPARLALFDDALCVLTSDRNARRIPIAFLVRAEKRDFGLEVETSDGMTWRFEQLGFDLETLRTRIEERALALRHKTEASISALDVTLSAEQAAALARLMPDGAGAPLAAVAALAPSLFDTLLDAADTCAPPEAVAAGGADGDAPPATPPSVGIRLLAESCSPERFLVGMKSTDDGTGGFARSFWFAAVGDTGRAVVEFVLADGEASASFVFRVEEGLPAFADRLNRALEALSFNRACIRLTDDELAQRGNDVQAMAVDRAPGLRFLRARFDGRIIHSSQETWTRAVRLALG